MESSIVSLCCLTFITIMTMSFFSKPKINRLEIKSFSYLLILNIIGLILQLTSYILIKKLPNFQNTIYYTFIIKSIFCYYILWEVFFVYYTGIISFSLNDKIKMKENKKRVNIFFGTSIIITLLIISLPIKIRIINNLYYPLGPSMYVLMIGVIYGIILLFYCILKNLKHIINVKYLPLFFYIIFGTIAIIWQMINPKLLLITPIESLSLFLMYFTLENPDMKLLKELHKAKEISDNANEEKTMFLYNMTQEIRNTTDKISDEADIILDSDSLEQDKDSARNIKGETAKFRSTVNDIMDVSAIDTSSIKIYNSKYNIKNLLKEIITIYTTISKNKNLEFRTNIEHNIPKLLYGDSINLKKSIMNILTTSIKSTDKVYIEFTVNTIIKNDICRLIITVEDSSIGRSSSELETIKQNNKSINESYKLITLMNGTMIISSDYGIGTKYKLIIDERIVNTTNPETNKYLKDYENKKILVIDDNKQTGLIFTKYLKNNHIAIDTAYTGRETLNKIKDKNKYDLIILDEELSQITGYELLKELKRLRNFTTKVILLTKDNNYEYNKKYQEEGFTDVLIKPFKKDILLTKLDKYLETK